MKNVPKSRYFCQTLVHSVAFCPMAICLRCGALPTQEGRQGVPKTSFPRKTCFSSPFQSEQLSWCRKTSISLVTRKWFSQTDFPNIRLVTTFAERKRAKKVLSVVSELSRTSLVCGAAFFCSTPSLAHHSTAGQATWCTPKMSMTDGAGTEHSGDGTFVLRTLHSV